MKLTAYFKHFLTQTVNLNQSRIDQLDARVLAVGNFLQGANGFGAAAEDLIAQGSYAHKTIIKPVGNHEFDADVLLPMAEQDDWEPKDYVDNLYTKLRGSATYRDLVSRRTRCVVVNYANEFHIDVVPYLVRDDGHWITNRRDNKLENTNPEGYSEWFDERDRIARRRLVEVVRLLKYLRDYKQTFSVRSVVLTYLLATQVTATQELFYPGCYDDLPSALVRLLTDLDAWLQARPDLPTMTDPSCPAQNFHDRWNQEEYANFRVKINGYAAKAQEAYAAEGVEASLKAWQEIFGATFVKPPVELKALQASAAPAVDDPEQRIDKDLHIPIDLSAGYRVKVRGRVRAKTGMGAYDLSKRGNRVLKRRTIGFDVVSCTVPEPYDVYWKVKNYGEEAERANCLRGQIVSGTKYKSEPTAYRGHHYVEVYIAMDGKCVAINRQRVDVL